MAKDFVTVKGKRYYVEDGTLDLSDKKITDIKEIKGLEHLKNLQTLNLKGNQIEAIRGLEHLKNLQTLSLRSNKIKEIEGLEHLKNLKKLSLSLNHIEELKGLEYLKNLQTLNLSDNDITEIKGLENLTNLKKLNLRGNSITEIRGLENLRNLRELYLTHNKIEEIKGLEHLKNLKKLNLSWIWKIEEIKGLEHLTNLQELRLNNNQIKEIKGLENLKNLQNLDLRGNKIRRDETHLLKKTAQEVVRYCQDKKDGKIPFVTFRGEKYYVEMCTLNLSSEKITDIKEIEGLEHLKNLKKLSLRGNSITEIRGLEHLSSLEELDLIDNPIRDDERHLVDMSAQDVVRYCQEKAKWEKVSHDEMVKTYFDIRKENNPTLDIRVEECFDFYGWKGIIDIVEFEINAITEEKRLIINEFKTRPPENVGEFIGNQIKKYKNYYPKYLRQEGDKTSYKIKTRLFLLDPITKDVEEFIDTWLDVLKNEDIEVFLLNVKNKKFYPYMKKA